jgi:hypothetical protein
MVISRVNIIHTDSIAWQVNSMIYLLRSKEIGPIIGVVLENTIADFLQNPGLIGAIQHNSAFQISNKRHVAKIYSYQGK